MGNRLERRIRKKVVTTTDIPRGDVRTAARLIEDRIGVFKHDDQLTEGDLNAAQKAIDKPFEKRKRNGFQKAIGVRANPFENLALYDEGLIRDNLPKIREYLKPDLSDGRGTFFANAFYVKAIRDPQLRDLALIIASAAGKDVSKPDAMDQLQINKDDFDAVWMMHSEGKAPTPPQGMTPKRFAEVFTEENLGVIRRFILTGEEDLIILRNIKIDGKPFEQAFPILEVKLPDPSAVVTPEQKADLFDQLRRIDRRFEKAGQDRIYVRGPENTLFVVPSMGPMEVAMGMRMQPGNEETGWKDTGQVLGVFNAKNSVGEATYVMWGNMADGITKGTDKLIKTEEGLQTEWNDPEESTAPTAPLTLSEKLMTTPGASQGAIFASLALGTGFVVDVKTTALLVGGVAALAQVSSLASAGRNLFRHQDNPFYHAAGVSLNRHEKIR
jgi:hypothetical protein